MDPVAEQTASRLSRLRLVVFSTCRLHVQIVRRNPLAVLCICAVSATLLSLHAYRHGRQFAGYLFAVWLGAFITDVVVALYPRDAIGFPIKHPKTQEALAVVAFTCAAIVPMIVRYSRLWPLHDLSQKLAFVAGLLLFTFFIAMACVFILVFRYKPRELGFNFRYWYLSLFIHPIFGVITFLVAPEKSHWQSMIRSDGFPGVFVECVLESAIPEEFMRMLLFTRLSAIFCNRGMGLFVATFLWACLHIPNFWSQSPQMTFLRAMISPWDIIPIGLLWGYITWRTRSLFPSVMAHGFNLWGLQNL